MLQYVNEFMPGNMLLVDPEKFEKFSVKFIQVISVHSIITVISVCVLQGHSGRICSLDLAMSICCW